MEYQNIVEAAFKSGYHSENHPDSLHSVHNLLQDARHIGKYLNENGVEVAAEDIWEALILGVEPVPYPEVQDVLFGFAGVGDTILIWTQGDTKTSHAQQAKVRGLGWEASLRNPNDRGNFVVYSAEDKIPLLPKLDRYSQLRGNSKMFLVDDKLENIKNAREQLTDSNQDIHYVWINRDASNIDATELEGIEVVTNLEEYNQMVEQNRQEGERITHIFDMDKTLIDPSQSKNSRIAEVTALLEGRSTKQRIARPRFHEIPIAELAGAYAISAETPFLTESSTNIDENSLDFLGHQASIMAYNGHLIKVMVDSDAKRPEEEKWMAMGGYEGAVSLVNLMQAYRNALADCGMNVPTLEQSQFYVLRKEDRFQVAEITERLGEGNLQVELLNSDLEHRVEILDEILEASLSVILHPELGADIKPANWVRHDNTIMHVDPLPIIMRDQATGDVYTEWPHVEDDFLQEFMYYTHISPAAVGYRLLQEFCQIDPNNRSVYADAIRTKVFSWQASNQIDENTTNAILASLSLDTSKQLEAVISGTVDLNDSFKTINSMLQARYEHGVHPIYNIRDMAFVIQERLLSGDSALQIEASNQALEDIRTNLGDSVFTKISESIRHLPNDLKFITIIRKLTHLGHGDSNFNSGEHAALNIIQNTVVKYR